MPEDPCTPASSLALPALWRRGDRQVQDPLGDGRCAIRCGACGTAFADVGSVHGFSVPVVLDRSAAN